MHSTTMPLQISIRRIRRPTCITVKAHNIPGARAVPLRHQVLIQAVAVVKVPITEAAAVGVAMTPRLLVGFERGLVDVALLAGVTNEAGDADARRGWSSVAGRQHTFTERQSGRVSVRGVGHPPGRSGGQMILQSERSV